MMGSLAYLLLYIGILFWLIQVGDLLIRDLRFFESHTHKLTWFLVLVAGNIVGAVWYWVWRKQVVAASSVPGKR
jgi:Na+-transporting NADH:ubiquinone oxidoreductase subunit NqrE